MTAQRSATRTDRQIQHEVLEELEWDSRVRPNEVGVSVKEGIVTLSGWVDAYTKRLAAEEAALRVAGVKAVANDLQVRLPSVAERTDADLARAALAALQWDADIATGALGMTVAQGWVTLKGVVDLPFQRDQAERAVHRLAGVRGVTNLLTVRARVPAPADVQQRIERALLRNAQVDAQGITVEVRGSTALLTGTVHSYAERRAAEGSALSAPGIAEVDNRLVVEYLG